MHTSLEYVVGVAVQPRALPGALSSRISEIVAPWSAPLMLAPVLTAARGILARWQTSVLGL